MDFGLDVKAERVKEVHCSVFVPIVEYDHHGKVDNTYQDDTTNSEYAEKIGTSQNYICLQLIADQFFNMLAGIQIVILKSPIEAGK